MKPALVCLLLLVAMAFMVADGRPHWGSWYDWHQWYQEDAASEWKVPVVTQAPPPTTKQWYVNPVDYLDGDCFGVSPWGDCAMIREDIPNSAVPDIRQKLSTGQKITRLPNHLKRPVGTGKAD